MTRRARFWRLALVPAFVGAMMPAAHAVPASLAAFSAGLDARWNYEQPAESAVRFRAELANWPAGNPQALIVQTQIARTQGLLRDYAAAHATLDGVEGRLAGMPAHVRVRYLLERGRTINSSGAPERAVPLFREALELAGCDGDDFYAIDAAHMLGIAAPQAERVDWDRQALAMIGRSRDPRAGRWRAPLHNNLGEAYFEAGEYGAALAQYRLALPAYQARGNAALVRFARWKVARAERSLGLLDDAERTQRRLAAENEALGQTDGYVFEELAEIALARGDAAGARRWAARAHAALKDDPDLAGEPERLARLAAIAQGNIAAGTKR